MSWGNIYCNTWWGDTRNTIYSIPVPPASECMFLETTQEYISRVDTDSGTTEAKTCLNVSLYKYGFN